MTSGALSESIGSSIRQAGVQAQLKAPMTFKEKRYMVNPMSFSEVLAELPALTIAERQAVICRALELDDVGLSIEEEALVERRLAEHRKNPTSALGLEEMKERLRSLRAK
jgi:putative addiction module component (TIGR02574 family)